MLEVGGKAFDNKNPHVKARKERPKDYPERFPVPDKFVSWNVPFSEYKPPYFVHQKVLADDWTKKPGGWADPEDIKKTLEKRQLTSYEGEVRYNERGFPLNPRGRTGIEGRGLLGKWGANLAVDSLVTRIDPETGKLQMIAIKRKDIGEWATPGGMVDLGEEPIATLKRELKEETGSDLDWSATTEVYRGYVDDPRNTDNAWMETQVFHLHLDPGQSRQIELRPGDDAEEARWFTITSDLLENLYASHGDNVRMAIKLWEEKNRMKVGSNGLVSES